MAHGFRKCLALYIVFKSSGCSSGACGLRVLKSGGKTSTSKLHAEMHTKQSFELKNNAEQIQALKAEMVPGFTKKVCRSFYLSSLVMVFVKYIQKECCQQKQIGENTVFLSSFFHCISQMQSTSVLMYISPNFLNWFAPFSCNVLSN